MGFLLFRSSWNFMFVQWWWWFWWTFYEELKKVFHWWNWLIISYDFLVNLKEFSYFSMIRVSFLEFDISSSMMINLIYVLFMNWKKCSIWPNLIIISYLVNLNELSCFWLFWWSSWKFTFSQKWWSFWFKFVHEVEKVFHWSNWLMISYLVNLKEFLYFSIV